MTTYTEAINAFYSGDHMSDRILAALRDNGIDPDHLTPDDIRTFEEFHIGGRKETVALAQRAGLKSDERVLDIGCGIGGPARTLATEFGCRVTGIDLAEGYVQAAAMLTERLGQSDRASFRCASGTDLPFGPESFDAVWTQHASMNIEDKQRLYSEVHRVLRPGGKFIFHDVMAGKVEPMHYPVPFADEPSIAFLVTPEEVRQLLEELGFTCIVWDDATERSHAWFARVTESLKRGAGPKIGMDVYVRERFIDRAANMTRNLAEDRLSVIQAVFTRP